MNDFCIKDDNVLRNTVLKINHILDMKYDKEDYSSIIHYLCGGDTFELLRFEDDVICILKKNSVVCGKDWLTLAAIEDNGVNWFSWI